ncbi:MAG: hypothetical protein HUU11_00290 [Anaerolineales bacterium]|nr:hypothetical protein [Anaerolineales bacterium]
MKEGRAHYRVTQRGKPGAALPDSIQPDRLFDILAIAPGECVNPPLQREGRQGYGIFLPEFVRVRTDFK